MPRHARLVLPNVPHHVTQRGVRKMQTFFIDDDYELYLKLLAIFTRKAGVSVLAWCLMPNHVHLLLVPTTETGLRAALGPLHRTYSSEVNKRETWTGHLWQARFASFPTDPYHTTAAARYIELNPVRAGMVVVPGAYRWSSARSHLTLEPDGITDLDGMSSIADDWNGLLANGLDDQTLKAIRQHEMNNFPLGSEHFVQSLEQEFDQRLRPGKRGRRWK